MSTKAQGRDCYHKAGNTEELFTLRAQDFSAPAVVDYWADLNEEQLGAAHPKIVEARQCAERMRAFPNRKMAD